MITKDQILNDYNVNNNIIASPGKFEGCMYYVVYFYNEVMHGHSDDTVHYSDGSIQDVFIITPKDCKLFPELEFITKVILSYTEAGFVHCNSI